ncbi:MAG: hypothetical protein P794_03930 [Epsilonproteobacteria bacterium (ex Lamellibrachia satsuma)]|nr:MAG: hypothetical protein P794_03930 [Epsilonproteobacteria bacterium (ex Lamellibrachia satsuma)]
MQKISNKATQKDWLTPEDVEQEFGIKINSQANMRSKKKIPYSKIGNFIYYSRQKLYKWFEDHHQEVIS